MGVRQVNSGNPETKFVWLTDNFVGGVNIAYADDTVEDGEFRQLLNYNLDSRGSLEKRKGYTKNLALTQLLFDEIDGQQAPEFPVFSQLSILNSPMADIVMLKMLENTNNVWTVLADYASVGLLQQVMSVDDEYILKILLIVKYEDGSNAYFINKYSIKYNSITREQLNKGTIDVDILTDRNLMNVSYGEDNQKLYITSNKQGLIMFNKETNEFTYSSAKTVETPNSVYKPSSLEIRKVGFNVLGDEPLSWIGASSITTESIQGVYLTTEDRIPIQEIPVSYKFQVNIIYTGTVKEFDIVLKDTSKQENNDLTITKTKNEDSSKDGLLVYDIEVKVQVTSDVEMNISIKDNKDIATYRDYFSIGTPNPQSKKVEKLNVGKMKVIEVGQRLVYYGKDTIWFSEINLFDYIPNYNYIILPIENTDEIVKIAFFRTCYVVFTRNRVYKLSGTFGNDDFSVSLINDSIGCIAPNSVAIVNNKLVFLSQIGLKELKYDVFRENLENLETLDDKINPLVVANEYAYGFSYRNQYFLLNNFRGANPETEIRYSTYVIPDTCRYYYEMESFVFDSYPVKPDGNKVFPYFITMINGTIYTILSDKDNNPTVYRYGDDYSDFGYAFDTLLETAGVNTGYPLHKKKFKNIILKTIGGELEQPLYVSVYADGTLYYDTWAGVAEVNSIGEVIYELIKTPTVTLPSSIAKLEQPVDLGSVIINPDGSVSYNKNDNEPDIESSIKLGYTKLGDSPIVVRKLKLPVACKNIAIKIKTTTTSKLNILSIGYTFKLGKVKE